jgi:hypothetical protein
LVIMTSRNLNGLLYCHTMYGAIAPLTAVLHIVSRFLSRQAGLLKNFKNSVISSVRMFLVEFNKAFACQNVS